MTHRETIKHEDQLDPLGSIFLPQTNNPMAEFSLWEAQILLRRGIAADATYEEQCRLYDELVWVRSYYMGQLALRGAQC